MDLLWDSNCSDYKEQVKLLGTGINSHKFNNYIPDSTGMEPIAEYDDVVLVGY